MVQAAGEKAPRRKRRVRRTAVGWSSCLGSSDINRRLCTSESPALCDLWPPYSLAGRRTSPNTLSLPCERLPQRSGSRFTQIFPLLLRFMLATLGSRDLCDNHAISRDPTLRVSTLEYWRSGMWPPNWQSWTDCSGRVPGPFRHGMSTTTPPIPIPSITLVPRAFIKTHVQ